MPTRRAAPQRREASSTVVGVVNQQEVCPRCGDVVDLRHNGTEQKTNEHTSPWVFADHLVDDVRGGQLMGRVPCPASGRNRAVASTSS